MRLSSPSKSPAGTTGSSFAQPPIFNPVLLIPPLVLFAIYDSKLISRTNHPLFLCSFRGNRILDCPSQFPLFRLLYFCFSFLSRVCTTYLFADDFDAQRRVVPLDRRIRCSRVENTFLLLCTFYQRWFDRFDPFSRRSKSRLFFFTLFAF